MKQLTQLLPGDLQKELYELWEVSICTGLLFIKTEFIWPVSVLAALDYLNVPCLTYLLSGLSDSHLPAAVGVCQG